MARDPQIGDTIRSVNPRRRDEHDRVRIDSVHQLASARKMVQSGRWVVVEHQEKERSE